MQASTPRLPLLIACLQRYEDQPAISSYLDAAGCVFGWPSAPKLALPVCGLIEVRVIDLMDARAPITRRDGVGGPESSNMRTAGSKNTLLIVNGKYEGSIYNATSFNMERLRPKFREAVETVCFYQVDSHAAVAHGKDVSLVDLTTNAQVGRMPGHEAGVREVVAATGYDGPRATCCSQCWPMAAATYGTCVRLTRLQCARCQTLRLTPVSLQGLELAAAQTCLAQDAP